MSFYRVAVRKNGETVQLRLWTEWVAVRAIARAIITNRLVGWCGPAGCGERVNKLITLEVRRYSAV